MSITGGIIIYVSSKNLSELDFMNMNIRIEKGPIFVRGLSRSGGTLLVTILDSHPSISMSYELYPTLFDDTLKGDVLAQVTERLISNKFRKDKVVEFVPAFFKFVARAERGGIDAPTLGKLLDLFIRKYGDLDSYEMKLLFIEKCCKHKMQKDIKSYWGLKCNNSYLNYLSIWPKANFINIIRDGRDVLASQLNTGAFKNSPAELGISWSNTHLKFRELMNEIPNQAFEIRYEDLVCSPEIELRVLIEKLNLPFNISMLNHSKRDLTLFKSHHLSMEQVKNPISNNQIGRWKKDLSAEVIEQFLSKARGTMLRFGYEV